MEEDDLKDLLSERSKRRQRTRWGCASELKLAAYVDHGLDQKARESLEAHLTDCESCLAQVAFLANSADWEDLEVHIPSQLLARARILVTNKQRTPIIWDWRWAATAAAACLVLAFGIVLTLRLHNSEPAQKPPVAQRPEEHPAAVAQASIAPRNPDVVASSKTSESARTAVPKPGPSIPLIRNAEPASRSPKLMFPRDGAIVKRGALQLRWQAVSNAVFYEVSVMTASGDTVVSQQTEGTSLKMSELQLVSGTKYFISVRAHLRDGKTARSRIVSFRVVE